jgi:hypothetical protein
VLLGRKNPRTVADFWIKIVGNHAGRPIKQTLSKGRPEIKATKREILEIQTWDLQIRLLILRDGTDNNKSSELGKISDTRGEGISTDRLVDNVNPLRVLGPKHIAEILLLVIDHTVAPKLFENFNFVFC